MGNAESSSEFPSREPGESHHDRNKKSAEEEKRPCSAAGTALKVGAAVAGTALLALGAWSAASSSSSGSGDRRDVTMEELDTRGRSSGAGRTHPQGSSRRPAEPEPFSYQLGDGDRNLGSRMIKIMSYNVWFREDLQLHDRMRAIGRLVQEHRPDLIFFQEVTPNIYGIFRRSDWWKDYNCSVPPERATRKYFCMLLSKLPVKGFLCVPFENSTMGRELCLADIDVGMGKNLIAVTTHLESPTPGEMNSEERVGQAKRALNGLNRYTNVVFGGDMNWDEDSDGPFPLDGWADAWADLRPGENGWTYDTKSNQMLKGNFLQLQKRLDRFICKLADFKLIDIKMIGMKAIPGLSYYKKRMELPVYPSDHYGLLLSMCLMQ